MTHPPACSCRKNTKQAVPTGKNYVKTSRLIEVICLISFPLISNNNSQALNYFKPDIIL